MTRDGLYAWEKLYVAMEILVASRASIRERLFDAWILSLMRASHKSHWPSDELFQKFTELKEDLEFLGPLRSALVKMPDEDVADFAKRIVSLFNAVARQTA